MPLPVGPLQLAKNHYTEGLVFCCPFSEKRPRDLFTGVPGTPNGTPTNTANADGNATSLKYSSSSYWTWPDSVFTQQAAGPTTVLWRGIMTTVATFRTFGDKGGALATSSFYTQIFADGHFEVIRGNGTGTKTNISPTASVVAGRIQTISWSFADNLIQTKAVMLVNGSPVTVSQGGTGTGANVDGGSVLRVGRAFDRQMDGDVTLFAMWHRQLSIQAQGNLHQDPSLLFEPVGRRTYAFLSSPTVTPHLLTTLGVGGMVVPSVGDTLAAAAGAALLRNPRVTRRRLLTGGQDGDD